MPIPESDFSAEACKRLRAPARRGSFRPLDAARLQLGLLSAGDDDGQARFYCLVNLDTKIIEDARFLAYGHLSSHPVADAYTELIRNTALEDALTLAPAAINALLSDSSDNGDKGNGDKSIHSFSGNDDAFAFIASAQKNLCAAFPQVKLSPKPIEKDVYARKREADWTDTDRAWFPLSLLKKIGALQKCIKQLLSVKLQRDDVQWSIEGLHDDFRIVIKIAGIPTEEKPTLLRFMEDAFHEHIHAGLSVEEHQA